MGAFRYEDMSSDCRYFGTRLLSGQHKLLIVKVSATVSEGRQVVIAVSLVCHRRNGDRQRRLARDGTLTAVVLLRHYIPVRRSPIIYCLRRQLSNGTRRPQAKLSRFVTALTVYEAYRIVPSPNDRGESNEQAIATT